MKWWTVYTNLPVNDTVRLPHPRSGDSQGQETFLAFSADKQTRNYDKTLNPLMSAKIIQGELNSKLVL